MDSILFKIVLLNKIVNLKTPLIMSLKNIKRIINYCVLIIGIGVWESCNPKSQHVLVPVDNVKSYKLSENHDTTTIIEERKEDSQEVIKFYQEGCEIFTSSYGGHKELLMSTTEMLDTIYSGDTYYREHRIQIKKENPNLFSTSIYHIDVKPVLVLTIYYDHSYNIKAIRNWLVYTTYKSEHAE
ncbi:hypothetical protein [Prevotella sp.]